MCNRDECIVVPGPYMDTAPLRKGAPATILGDFARRYHAEVAPLVSPVWGWSATNTVGNSNHLAGTSLDINAPQWPWGLKRMPQWLVDKIYRLLDDYKIDGESGIKWGREWGKPDEMHFQLRWREGDPRNDRLVAKILNRPLPAPGPSPAPVTNTTVYLQRGSKGPEVGALQSGLNRVFPSYSRLAVDDDFGLLTESVVREFQRRSGLLSDGIVGPQTRAALGVFGILGKGDGAVATPVPAPAPQRPKPWLFTVHGTGQPDPMGPGLPRDTALDVLDIYRWQPIGNYSARAFPMWPSVMEGYEELVLQIDQRLSQDDSDFAMAGYSQGAIVVGQVLKHEIQNPNGRLHKYLPRLKKVVFWGNPMRQTGFAHFDEWKYPIAPADSGGILEDKLELDGATFEVRDYAHAGDMYASILDNDRDEYKVAIGRLVMKAINFYGGPNSLVAQLIELGQRPLEEGIAMARAIIDAIKFFANLDQHNYNRFPAVAFLRS
jgi:hypothetical protein